MAHYILKNNKKDSLINIEEVVRDKGYLNGNGKIFK